MSTATTQVQHTHCHARKTLRCSHCYHEGRDVDVFLNGWDNNAEIVLCIDHKACFARQQGQLTDECELCGQEGAVLGEQIRWVNGTGYEWFPIWRCADEEECSARVYEQEAPEPRWQVG